MHWKHYSEVKPNQWFWPNFSPFELASKGDGSLLVDVDALDKLQEMRRIVGKPMRINSAYRDPIHNANVGGAPMSMHKFARAFDVSLAGHDKHDLKRAAKDAGFTGFGYYNSFLHVDTGRARRWGKWS